MADTVVSFPDAEQTAIDEAITRKYAYQERLPDGTPQDPNRTKLNPETREAFLNRKYGEIIVQDVREFLKADYIRTADEKVPKFNPTAIRAKK